jgi:hypothetical protein
MPNDKKNIIPIKSRKLIINGGLSPQENNRRTIGGLEVVSNEVKAAFLWNEGKIKDKMTLIGEFAYMPIKHDEDASEIKNISFVMQFSQPNNTIFVYKDRFDHYWAFPKTNPYARNNIDFFRNLNEIYDIDKIEIPRDIDSEYKIELETATELEINPINLD